MNNLSLKCAGPEIPRVSSYFYNGKYLLEMDRLDEIAIRLEEVTKSSEAYEPRGRGVLQDRAELQEYCFTVLLNLCEKGDWKSVKKVQAVIQGLRDSQGRTILSIYVKDHLPRDAEDDIVCQIVNKGCYHRC